MTETVIDTPRTTWSYTLWWENKVRACLRSLDRRTPRWERARRALAMEKELETLVLRMEGTQR